MSTSLTFIALSLVMLIAGSELLVRGAVGFARSFRIPATIIGLTVVAYGTASPELIISTISAINGSPDLALGNIIGSALVNILLVIGVIALFQPLKTGPSLVRRDALIMLGATVFLALFCLDEEIDRVEGLMCLAALMAYTWFTCKTATQRATSVEAQGNAKCDTRWCAASYMLIGSALLFSGVDIFIEGMLSLARGLNVSEATIALTAAALATSLPELVTSVTAARKGEAGLSLAVIVSGTIFTLLGISGLAAFANPIPVSPVFLHGSLWILVVASGLCLLALKTKSALSRKEGLVFVALYAATIVYQYRFIA